MYPIVSISELEKNGYVQLLRGSGISKKDFSDIGKFPCIHYGDLYTLYTPIIQNVLRKTNVDGKIKSLEGDVLVPATTTADAMGIAIARALDENGVIIGGDINIIRTRNKVLLSSYLSYMINFPLKRQLAQYAKGVNILHLNNNDIRMLRIPVPSIQEQKLIVEKTTKLFVNIDKVKANAEQNLTNTKELFESALNDAFTKNTEGWEEKTLGSISELKQNKAEVKNIDANTLVSFVPMEYLGINQKYFNSNQSKPIKNLIKSYTYFAENDVIMAKITPCFENGKIGIANALMNKIGFGSSEYIVFRPNKDINNEYLYYFLNREAFRKEGAQNMLGAVGHKRVSKEFIENYPFSYPSPSEQQKIVEKLDALQEQTKRLEQIYMQKIKECDELKQSILQKAFRGEL